MIGKNFRSEILEWKQALLQALRTNTSGSGLIILQERLRNFLNHPSLMLRRFRFRITTRNIYSFVSTQKVKAIQTGKKVLTSTFGMLQQNLSLRSIATTDFVEAFRT